MTTIKNMEKYKCFEFNNQVFFSTFKIIMWEDAVILDYWDVLLTPFFLIVIYAIAILIKNKHLLKDKEDHYKYFIPALTCKLIGGIALCIIYTYYYGGGDPVSYFLTSQSYVNILLHDGIHAFLESANYYANDIYLNQYFNQDNGIYWFHNNDYYALFVVILTTPITLLGCKSFVGTTLILATLTYIGTWKIYEIFIYHFPNKKKEFAYAILFVPSVFFWGSGILKDTYTFCFLGLITYCIFKYFKLKERKIKYILYLVLFSFLMIMIKPYILVAILPGAIVWIGFERISSIKNKTLRLFGVPMLLGGLMLFILIILTYFSDYLGEYGMDRVLDKAVKTQKDLLREDYGANNFNIGEFDANLGSILSKFPIAVSSTLFRPFLWDIRNPVMLISAIENTFILYFTLYVVFKVKTRMLFGIILSYPLLIFSLLFSLFFAFSVGLTTANFGALVRLKIPCVPFYTASLLMILELYKQKIGNKSGVI